MAAILSDAKGAAIMIRRLCSLGFLVLYGFAGCGEGSRRPPQTGATAAVQAYFEALQRRQWQTAYAALDAESQHICTLEQFTTKAEAWHKNLGFEPRSFHIRSCTEQGSAANARVVISGFAADQKRKEYRDAVALRYEGQSWRVILPPHLGQKSEP